MLSVAQRHSRMNSQRLRIGGHETARFHLVVGTSGTDGDERNTSDDAYSTSIIFGGFCWEQGEADHCAFRLNINRVKISTTVLPNVVQDDRD